MVFCDCTACCLSDIAISMNIFSAYKTRISMSHKKEIEEPLDAEQAKDLELDETPKAHKERKWLPTFGAVLGFIIGFAIVKLIG